MFEVYGFTIDEQLTLEKYFDSLSEIKPLGHPVILEHSTLEQRQFDLHYVHKVSGSVLVDGIFML